MKYSKTTGSFYDPDSNYSELPDDLIEVTFEAFTRAVDVRANGGSLDVIDGQLLIIDISPGELAKREIAIKVKSMEAFVQAHMDGIAKDQGLGFDDIKSAMLGAQFAGDHQATSLTLGAWYYSVWAACKSLLHLWQSGSIDEPTAEDVMAALPKYIAPQADK